MIFRGFEDGVFCGYSVYLPLETLVLGRQAGRGIL